MKTLAQTIVVAAVMLAISTPAFTQTPVAPTTEQANPPKNNDQVRALICAQPWSWERPGEDSQIISFAPNGNVTNNHWVARYTIVDLHKVTLRLKDKTTKIVFSDDYTSYTGRDFNGATPVSGKPKKPK